MVSNCGCGHCGECGSIPDCSQFMGEPTNENMQALLSCLVQRSTDLMREVLKKKCTLDAAVREVQTQAVNVSDTEDRLVELQGELANAISSAQDVLTQAVNVVYGGGFSVVSSPGSVPVGNSEGKLDLGWLPDGLMDQLCGLESTLIYVLRESLSNYADLLKQGELLDIAQGQLVKHGEVLSDLQRSLSDRFQGVSEAFFEHDSRLDGQLVDINKLGATLAWQSETEASYKRTMGQSGLFGVRHYRYHGDLRQPHTENGQPAHMHNHPQYKNLAGSGEVQFVMNGYSGRTRHRDYGLYRPKSKDDPFLAVEYIEPPALPASVTTGTVQQQSDAMRDLFVRYHNGEMPEGFGWTMAVLQAWFQPFAEELQDAYQSDRHQQDVNTLSAALRHTVRFSAGGGSHLGENDALEPLVARTLDANGRTVYGVLKHRMICVDVSELGDLRPYLDRVDDPIRSEGWGSESNRYLIRENVNGPSKLDEMMYLLPGLDGYGSDIEERYIAGGNYTIANYYTGERLNASRHTRFMKSARRNASNRLAMKRGFNDPYLFVASTTREEVVNTPIDGLDYRFSYAIPMELILRTPLESWNPYDIPMSATYPPSGNGSAGAPYEGNHSSLYYYRTPVQFFSGSSFADGADTVSAGGAWFRGGDGQAYQVRESGLWVWLPKIAGIDEQIQTRYAIFPDHTEGGKAWQYAEAVRREGQSMDCELVANQLYVMRESLKLHAKTLAQ